MTPKRKGKIVVLHLAARYPFAGVIWQLLHHLVGFRQLGCDVYYIEDNNAYVYDLLTECPSADSSANLKLLGGALARFGFADHWAFLDPATGAYIGMSAERCRQLLLEADAVINLCGATEPREEHAATRCLVYLGTDPGIFEVKLAERDPASVRYAAAHKVLFTYAYNIGADDCLLPSAGVQWHRTRPPVLLDEWRPVIEQAEARSFTTVGTWRNKGSDVEINGQKFYWSKHVNFLKVLDVGRRAGQPIELAMGIEPGPDYERALAAGLTFTPPIPMSLDLDRYRNYLSSSRGEFTVAKDVVARARTGWFSDRSVSYLAAGRPVVTLSTGFEKYLPTGEGLFSFEDSEQAADAIVRINRDYQRHCRAARALAEEYFDALKLLDQIAEVAGL